MACRRYRKHAPASRTTAISRLRPAILRSSSFDQEIIVGPPSDLVWLGTVTPPTVVLRGGLRSDRRSAIFLSLMVKFQQRYQMRHGTTRRGKAWTASRPGLRRGPAYGGCRVCSGILHSVRVPLRPVAETTAWTNLSAWCWTIRPKRCWRIWAPGAPKKPIDASYKLLVIISQGCATYSGDCLFKNTVEAVIRNGDQGYNPA